MTIADLMQRRVDRAMKQPHDFSAVLGVLRELETHFIRCPESDIVRLLDWTDRLDVIREFAYERATPDEMRVAAGRIRSREP